MGTDLVLIAIFVLVCCAIVDLMVGVGNDAVNFLNSSIGSRAAPRWAILAIASMGILAGVVFSGGMMEVARKGIFHPHLFTMPELMTIFLAVMLTDVILLDLYNTFGLPTSTTVSIVFELLGAAVVVSLLKIRQAAEAAGGLGEYINTAKAMAIISGILLSVAVAFVCGMAAMYLSRVVFTFDYRPRLRRYGALWGGLALASITWFILVKGAKGASFMTADTAAAIRENGWAIMTVIFAISAALLQVLIWRGVNVLKPIVLVGTFALALAFAANDLMNFIGVPLAGLHAYRAAMATDDPMNSSMEALAGKVPSEWPLLLLAGVIMAVTLVLSRKARSVTETEITLGRQEEGHERFGSTFLSRSVVRMALSLGNGLARVTPGRLRAFLDRRTDPAAYELEVDDEKRPRFDLLRAAVNLMVASAVISFATSQKLPLSTTYVTFMVAMGTSFSDRAWGRETAVYRVTGVLTVIGGWFMTALMAFTVAGAFALLLYFTQAVGVVLLVALAAFAFYRSHHAHGAREREAESHEVFNLRKLKGAEEAIPTTFHHVAILLREVRESVDKTLESLFLLSAEGLRAERLRDRKLRVWTQVVTANVFKCMRLLQQSEATPPANYSQVVRRLQKLADGHRDIVRRSYAHVGNHHAGLLSVQVEELQEVRERVHGILLHVEEALDSGRASDVGAVMAKEAELRDLARGLRARQALRVQDESSKTRLSILYYALLGNLLMVVTQAISLLRIFNESFGDARGDGDEFATADND